MSRSLPANTNHRGLRLTPMSEAKRLTIASQSDPMRLDRVFALELLQGICLLLEKTFGCSLGGRV